ncbi:hypothetical protein CDD83_9961 [Cordyceps sp. RAO-2017]|nr:hypothetical protein CDD83_9961 [Cordyceps sp. RAO-2017]
MERFRAPSLFQPTNFVAAIESRNDGQQDDRPQHLFGALMTIPHTQVARTLAVLGFDFIFVDTLHAPTTAEKLVDIIHTINFTSEGKTCALVRVPSPESDLLGYALDAGAAGIIFPQIDTAAEAAAAVYKVRYAYSGGTRSVSPVALLDGISNMAPPGWTAETVADRNIAVICQIESVLGIENVNAIARTPGVNGLMLGAGDLRISLGLPSRSAPGQGDHPDFHAAVAKLVAASKSCGMPLLAPAFRMDSDASWLRSFKMLLTGVDLLSMVKSHRQDLAKMKGALLGSETESRNGHGGTHGGLNGAHGGHSGTHSDATPSDRNGAQVGVNGTHDDVTHSDRNGAHGDLNGAHGNLNGTHNGNTGAYKDLNGTHGGLNGVHCGLSEAHTDVNGAHNGNNGAHNDLAAINYPVPSAS